MAWILSQCALYFHINGKRTSLLWSSFCERQRMTIGRCALPVIAQKFLGQPMFDHFWKKKKFLENTTTFFVAWVSGLARSQGLAHLRPLEWAGESYQSFNQPSRMQQSSHFPKPIFKEVRSGNLTRLPLVCISSRAWGDCGGGKVIPLHG